MTKKKKQEKNKAAYSIFNKRYNSINMNFRNVFDCQHSSGKENTSFQLDPDNE